jgi:antitoxin ParD1/3/4/toxin ParE1/3/4
MPSLGHLREDLTPLPLLFWPVGMYLIIYRLQQDRIEVIAVTQGSRHVPALLKDRNSA